MKPIVKVIAYTKFLGVPDELLPDGRGGSPHAILLDRHQNEGSGLAKLTECAGRTCYDSYGVGRSSKDYHKHILEVGHGSVLEHASISFYLAGISRGCTHELVRHRAGTAISQRSTRYVDESESEWAWHPLITEFLDDSALGMGIPNGAKNTCATVYRDLVEHVQDALVKRGVDKLTARKQARGAARGVLGNALETALVWTANLRALRNVIEQRASRFADAEIRVLANRLWEEGVKVCPEYLSDYVKGECPDGIGFELTTEHRKV